MKKTSAKQSKSTGSKPKTTKPIRAGIIGLGRAGWNLHLHPLRELPGFEIAGVVDPVAERCAEARDLTGCEVFPNLDALLKKSDADLVVVATPSHTHFSDIKKVLHAGRHCIAEKPMAFSASQARQLLALARQKRRKLFVHHSHLHSDVFWHLKSVIDSGKLGPLFSIRTFWGHYGRRWDWQTLKEFGGGQLNNTAPHVLSILLPLLGSKVSGLFADLRNIKDAGDAEDHVHLVLDTEKGVTADVVVSSAFALACPRWILAGRHGTYLLDGEKGRLRYYDPAKAPKLRVLRGAAPGRKYLREDLPWQEEELEVKPAACGRFHENVYAVLTAGAKQVVTPESAMEVVRVIELATREAERKAAARGRKGNNRR